MTRQAHQSQRHHRLLLLFSLGCSSTLPATTVSATPAFPSMRELLNPKEPVPAIDEATLKREIPRLLKPLLTPPHPKQAASLPGDGLASHLGMRPEGLCPEAEVSGRIRASAKHAARELKINMAPCVTSAWPQTSAAAAKSPLENRQKLLSQAPSIETDEASLLIRQFCQNRDLNEIANWTPADMAKAIRQSGWDLCPDSAERSVMINASYKSQLKLMGNPLQWQADYLFASSEGKPCQIKNLNGELVMNGCRTILDYTKNDIFDAETKPQRYLFVANSVGLRGKSGNRAYSGGYYELQLNQWKGQLFFPGGADFPRYVLMDERRNVVKGTLDPDNPLVINPYAPVNPAAPVTTRKGPSGSKPYGELKNISLPNPIVVMTARPDNSQTWDARWGRILNGRATPGETPVFSEPLRYATCSPTQPSLCWASTGSGLGEVSSTQASFKAWPAATGAKAMTRVTGMSYAKSTGQLFFGTGKGQGSLFVASVIGKKKVSSLVGNVPFDFVGLAIDDTRKEAVSLATMVGMKGLGKSERPLLSFLVRLSLGTQPSLVPIALNTPIPYDPSWPSTVQLLLQGNDLYAVVYTRIPKGLAYHALHNEGEVGTWVYRINPRSGDVDILLPSAS